MTQIIETLNKYDSKELNLFDYHMTQKNWTFIEPFFLSMTQRFELFFWNMTQKNWILFLSKYDSKRIESFFVSEIWLKKNCIFFFWNMTQKELNLFSLENWTFLIWIWFKELNLLWVLLKVFHIWFKDFFKKKNQMTQRIEIFYNIWLKELTLFFFEHMFKNWFFSVWFTELNLLYMTQRIVPYFLNMTQRI